MQKLLYLEPIVVITGCGLRLFGSVVYDIASEESDHTEVNGVPRSNPELLGVSSGAGSPASAERIIQVSYKEILMGLRHGHRVSRTWAIFQWFIGK